MAYEHWGALGPGMDPIMSLQGLGAYETWGPLGPGGDPAASLQGLGAWQRWGQLGPGGDPAMSLQGGLGQAPARAGMVGPMMAYAVPIVPALQRMMRAPAFPTPSPVAAQATTTAALGRLTQDQALRMGWIISSLSAAGLGAFIGWYHGGKRSGGKIGAKWGWGIAGSVFPVPTTVVAAVQGFGKRR